MRARTLAGFVLMVLALLFSCVVIGNSQSTSTLERKCTGPSPNPARAGVVIEKDGDVVITPCSGKKITTNGDITGNTVKVYDPNFTALTGATSYFSVGSNSQIVPPSSANWIPASIDFNIAPVPTTAKSYIGQYLRLRMQGNFTSAPADLYGQYIFIDYRGATNGAVANNVYGGMVNVNLDAPAKNAYGLYVSSFHGGTNATADRLIGVSSMVTGVHNGNTIGEAVGGEFIYRTSDQGTSLAKSILARVTTLPSHTLQSTADVRGLSLDGWTTAGSFGTSYGIYADSSIDIGSTRYFIYSTSTSPSVLSGPLSFDGDYASPGSTGNKTIHKPAFSVRFAAAATSLTVTNNLIGSQSKALCSIQTADATMKSVAVSISANTIVLIANAAATAETEVYCEIRRPN